MKKERLRITDKDVLKIREIYLSKKDIRDYPELRIKLFNKYYPDLNFDDYKNADLWHCCVIGDFCGDLMSCDEKDNDEVDMTFGDKPGPVG